MPPWHRKGAIYMTNAILVTCARTEDLDAATRDSIIQVCISAFQEEDFRNLFAYIPRGGRHFLAYRETELVSHAVVTTRWLQPEGLPLMRTAYVDAVATLPEVQGQGYGSAVMRRLAMSIDDYEIACLQTERTGFYERLGWEAWRGPLAGRSEQGLVPTPERAGVMVLRLPHTPALDLEASLTIECQRERIW
jgi:aminoglycoside 2'-N-acetyltransferase I